MSSIDKLSLEEILEFFIAEPERHRRLLNTFSMIENIGAQKIHRFQRFGFTSEFVLRHAAEEARHALFFKSKTRFLGKRSPMDFSKDQIIAPSASRNYLRQLDIKVNRYLKINERCENRQRLFLAYLLTTLLIELRANTLYRTYEAILRNTKSPISIRSVINEERHHLREIESILTEHMAHNMNTTLIHMREFEECVYRNWIKQISETEKIISPRSEY